MFATTDKNFPVFYFVMARFHGIIGINLGKKKRGDEGKIAKFQKP